MKNYNQGVYILTCSQDGTLSKIDIRRLDKAVCYYEHDDFICNNAHTRMSLSNNDSYAVVPSGANKLIVFDLNSGFGSAFGYFCSFVFSDDVNSLVLPGCFARMLGFGCFCFRYHCLG